MGVSATQPTQAHHLSPVCPLRAHARGRRAVARACVRELSAATAPPAGGWSSPPAGLRAEGTGALRLAGFPRLAKGWEASAAGAPPGSFACRAPTDKQIFADYFATTEAYEPKQTSGRARTPVEARLAARRPRGARVPRPSPQRHRGSRPPPPPALSPATAVRSRAPASRPGQGVLDLIDEDKNQINHFLNFQLDYMVLFL